MVSFFRRRASFCHFLSIQMGLGLLLTLSLSLLPTSPAQASLRDLWNNIFDSNPPDPPSNGGSRGDLFCPIAPNALPNTAMVLSDHPTLTWVSSPGSVKRVEILQGETVIWSSLISDVHQVQSPIPNPTIATYQITVDYTLEPGQQYQWRTIRFDNVVLRSTRFQMLAAEERNRITQDLNQLNQKLSNDRITEDATTLQRASFFANQQLWAEFWDEVLSIQHPASELNTVVAETITTFCPTSSRSRGAGE
jgi:hypothetical protein